MLLTVYVIATVATATAAAEEGEGGLVYLRLLHVHMHLVSQVGGWQAGSCCLVAVEHHPQAISKDVQPVVGVA